MMNYFSEWLLNRFREGYALSRNPFYHDVVNRIELSPENIGVVEFCSKNYRPILPRLHEITDRFGSRNLLFGSGLPTYEPSGALGLLYYSSVTQEDRENIAFRNWERLEGGIRFDD